MSHIEKLKTMLQVWLSDYNITSYPSGNLETAPSIYITPTQFTSTQYMYDESYNILIKATSQTNLESAIAALLQIDSRHPDGFSINYKVAADTSVTITDSDKVIPLAFGRYILCRGFAYDVLTGEEISFGITIQSADWVCYRSFGGYLWMLVWNQIEADGIQHNALYQSTDGLIWTEVTANASYPIPMSFCEINSRLYTFWRTSADDSNVYIYYTTNGTTWLTDTRTSYTIPNNSYNYWKPYVAAHTYPYITFISQIVSPGHEIIGTIGLDGSSVQIRTDQDASATYPYIYGDSGYVYYNNISARCAKIAYDGTTTSNHTVNTFQILINEKVIQRTSTTLVEYDVNFDGTGGTTLYDGSVANLDLGAWSDGTQHIVIDATTLDFNLDDMVDFDDGTYPFYVETLLLSKYFTENEFEAEILIRVRWSNP